MQGFQVQDNVDDFMKGFLNPEAPTETIVTPTPVTDTVQNFLQDKPTETTPPAETPKEGDVKKVEEFVKEEKKEEENTSLVKDVVKLAEVLKEKEILLPFEDDTLPTTEEELIDGLIQSIPHQVQQKLEAAWQDKVSNLSPSLQTIHQYAEMGVTTAQQLSSFTNAVAQTEAVAQLDPKTPEDQEQIVLLQLLNTGMGEKEAREEVADLKERNKLEARATQYFPTLRKAYEDNVSQLAADKAREEENIQRYIQTNAANSQYFLEKDTEYLPFKIAPQDKNYKQAVFQLAGQVVDRQEDGSPVFGWQKHIESLQFGDEASYKKYMKIMAFAANIDKYEENVAKKGSSTATATNFKKIKTTSGTHTNVSSEPELKAGIKKQGNPWSV